MDSHRQALKALQSAYVTPDQGAEAIADPVGGPRRWPLSNGNRKHGLSTRQCTQREASLQDPARQCPNQAHAFDIFCSNPGLGRVTAVANLAECLEIGTITRTQIASLAGLAPKTGHSVEWRGKAFLQAARRFLRTAFHMTALARAV